MQSISDSAKIHSQACKSHFLILKTIVLIIYYSLSVFS